MNRLFAIGLVLLLMSVPLAQAQQADLQDFVDESAPSDNIALALWVSTPDDTYSAVTGLANLESGTPVTVDDLFRIGSITKIFTSTLILMLEEEGTLSIDDPLTAWLSADITGRLANGDTVTLQQLMNMTSGIPDYLDTDAFWEAVEDSPSYPWTAPETITYIYDDPPMFAPSEGYAYSNTNYNLLEMVIQAASGMSFADAMEAYIFSELGMENSFVEDPNTLGVGIIQGYARDDDGSVYNATLENDGVGMGDGGIISTVQDLGLFIRGLFGGDLLTDASLAAMRDGVPEPDDPDLAYGLGLNIIDASDTLVLGHEGSTAGFTSALWYFEEYDTVVVAFTNEVGSDVIGVELIDTAFVITLGE